MSSHDRVAQALGTEILGGLHPVGRPLPNEQLLLARFGVSRTVLREAIKTLSAKGLVVAKTRVGTRVLDPIHWNYFDAEVLAWKLQLGFDQGFRLHLAEVRRAIEPAAAALAAQGMAAQGLAAQSQGADQISDLRRWIERMGAPGHDRQSFAEADLGFHLAVGAVSGNPFMRSFASVIETALLASFSHSAPSPDDEEQARIVADHARIVDAIEAGDPAAARRAMEAVIDAGLRRQDSARPSARARGSRK